MPPSLSPLAVLRPFLVVFASLAMLEAACGDGWPEWRGAAGDGHAPSAHDLPRRWSETENVVWKASVPGKGWSSPVMDGRQIWLTTAVESELSEEEKQRRLDSIPNASALELSGPVSLRAICLDRETGELVHDVELFLIDEPQPIHKLNSYASPSPVLADGTLYCHFGDFGTAAVDTESGAVRWANRLLRLNHENGPGSTPVLWHDKLIVHCDGSDVQFIAALDAATGELAWKTPRSGELRDDPQLKKAYGTPLVITHQGQDVLISPAADWVYAYDPNDGCELWKVSYGVLGFSVVPRPVISGDMVYLSTTFMQPELLALKLAGPESPPEIVWREKKGVPTMPSPIVVGSELYMVSEKGVATCLDAERGENCWTERLGGNFSSSPLFADGVLYLANREGETFVVRPGREFALEATNQLDGAIMASPIAVGSSLYLRTEHALYRIGR
ncbi:MAG: PQQ-binding-like beta-propeller repeat protein [Pirellulales bacterium]